MARYDAHYIVALQDGVDGKRKQASNKQSDLVKCEIRNEIHEAKARLAPSFCRVKRTNPAHERGLQLLDTGTITSNKIKYKDDQGKYEESMNESTTNVGHESD